MKRSYSEDRQLAVESGRKGGTNVPSEKRSFARNPELARRAGKKGGQAPRRKKTVSVPETP